MIYIYREKRKTTPGFKQRHEESNLICVTLYTNANIRITYLFYFHGLKDQAQDAALSMFFQVIIIVVVVIIIVMTSMLQIGD